MLLDRLAAGPSRAARITHTEHLPPRAGRHAVWPDRIRPEVLAAVRAGGGYWSANTVTLPLPGTWTMRATVRVSEIDQVSETRRIRVER